MGSASGTEMNLMIHRFIYEIIDIIYLRMMNHHTLG